MKPRGHQGCCQVCFEAVVAHELERIRWKDPYIKICSALFASLLWWIPLKGWLNKIEMDQEEASDRGCLLMGYPPSL